MNLLEMKNVSKSYSRGKGLFGRKEKIAALNDVTLALSEGTCLGLVGESGCGKTSLGKVVLRLEKPDSGEVFFQGKNIYQTSRADLKEIYKNMQVVFQDSYSSVNPRLTAGMTISEPLRNYHRLSPSEEMVKVEELLTTVGLNPEDKGKYPHQFSGGQLQRVCIARAISLKPKMIVLDEAVSSLDVSVQAQILNLLADLKEQFRLSYVFISHDIEAVYYLSDSLAVMYLGRIVELIHDIRTVNEVLHPYSKKLLSSVLFPHPRYRKHIDCRVDELSLSATAKGCSYASRCEIAGDTCLVGPPPLVRVEDGHFVACCMI